MSTPKVWDNEEIVTATDLNVVAAQAADALKPSGNLAGLANLSTARGNMGLGNAAVLNVGTAVGTVAAGNDGRMVGAMQRTNNLTDVASISAARAALGIDGPSDVWPVGTTDGTVMAGDDRRVVGVLAFGAVGDGTTNDTAAIQAAFDAVPAGGGVVILPAGFVFAFNATLYLDSNTTLTGGGTLKGMPVSGWSHGSPYRGLSNRNLDAGSITDENITIDGITVDYSEIANGTEGTDHCIRIRRARKVVIRGCNIIGGASSVALLGCDDTLEDGNTYTDFYNCGSDHWDEPKNSRVVGCHIETETAAQLMNFNPERSTGSEAGLVADGFTFIGNTLISAKPTGNACQVEPLATGNTVKNVTIANNVFKNGYLVMRGDVRGATVSSNTLSDFLGPSAAIYCSDLFGVNPSGLIIIGNTIRDPLTESPAEGVIVAQSASAIVALNTITGTSYSTPSITGVGEPLQTLLNWVEDEVVVGRLSGGARLINGADSYWGWTDTAGGIARMRMQSDDNWVWLSTSSTGTDRTVASLAARSDGSEIRWSVPTFWNNYTRHALATVAAAGTTIAGATAVSADTVVVSTCSAGVADGVSLFPVDGQRQTVINITADTLKVYPNNSGSAQIDNGGASVPVTIAAGKSKTFTRVAAGDFRTVAAT